MPEGRRRQIIKTRADDRNSAPELDSGTQRESVPAFEPPRESLLEKKVYIPIPLMVFGLFAIMVLSFSATYLVIKWPSQGLELAENIKLQAYREDLTETTLSLRRAPEAEPLGLQNPSADVTLPTTRAGHPEAYLTASRNALRPSSLGRARGVSPPLAEIRGFTAPSRPKAQTDPVRAPSQRRGPGSFRKPAAITPPSVNLNPGSFQKSFAFRDLELPSPRLLKKRYAARAVFPEPLDLVAFESKSPRISKAGARLEQKFRARRFANRAGFPDADQAVNPLTVPATGAGLQARTARFSKADEVAPPVADPGGLGRVRKTPEARDALGQVPGQKLMVRRFATATTFPEGGAGTNPLIRPLQGEVPNPKSRSFQRALGINPPAADLVLGASSLPQASPEIQIPDQKLRPRRYARATVGPEKLTADLPGATPGEGTIFRTPEEAEPETLAPWRRYAAAVPPDTAGKGKIVIIIDDMGNNTRMSEALADLAGPLNFAFLPYAPNLAHQTSLMRRRGHELLVHMPMEPTGTEYPGPKALETSLSDAELMEALEWNLSRFEGFVGVNNHMGSRFTADERRMRMVMQVLKQKGLLFLDSLTTSDSTGVSLARLYDVPWAGRDIFIDNLAEEEAILRQLEKVERLARKRGLAIAIGHPNRATLKVLKSWIPGLKTKGLVLVPLSSVVTPPAATKLAGGG